MILMSSEVSGFSNTSSVGGTSTLVITSLEGTSSPSLPKTKAIFPILMSSVTFSLTFTVRINVFLSPASISYCMSTWIINSSSARNKF